MAQAYPALSDLVGAMNSVPSTNLWDVVCSYSVDQLNEFLKAKYDAGTLAKDVTLSTDRLDPLTNEDFTITYDIKFASPVLTFISGRSGVATLTMEILEGSSYSVGPKVPDQNTPKPTPVAIPGGTYSVKAVIPLAAISGDTGEVIEQGDVLTFSDNKEHENNVILHFKNEKGASYQITPEPDASAKDVLTTYFLPVLEQYFQNDVKETDYALSTVNNSQPSSGLTLFTPKSFVFASMGDDDTGVLSLYIQTKQSGNPAGNLSPSFQPGDQSVFPIPAGYTASIILSYSLITQAFLAPQLASSGFSVSFDTVADGISAQLTEDASVVADGKDGNYTFEEYSYDGLHISLKTNPLHFVIRDGQLSLQWKGESTSTWQQVVTGGNTAVAQYGKVDITIDLNKGPIPLALSDDNVTIADVAISRSDFSVHIKGKKCKKGEFILGCSDHAPDYYSKMKLTIPSITISLRGFDFFRTTNLLAPGNHVITIAQSEGLQTPHDFLIVGEVQKPTTFR